MTAGVNDGVVKERKKKKSFRLVSLWVILGLWIFRGSQNIYILLLLMAPCWMTNDLAGNERNWFIGDAFLSYIQFSPCSLCARAGCNMQWPGYRNPVHSNITPRAPKIFAWKMQQLEGGNGGGRGCWSCYIPFYSRLVHHWTWPVVQTFQEHYRADDSAMGLAFEQLISIYNRYLQYNEKCIFTRTKVFGGRFSFYMQFFFVCLLVFYLLLLRCRFEWCNAH